MSDVSCCFAPSRHFGKCHLYVYLYYIYGPGVWPLTTIGLSNEAFLGAKRDDASTSCDAQELIFVRSLGSADIEIANISAMAVVTS